MATTASGSYDAVSITVSPDTLNETAKSVQGLVNDIINQLNSINTTMSDLQLSWVGQSATLANTFNQEWNSATQTLFGTQQNPSQGVLNRLASGLQSAASNYDGVEQWVQESFGNLVSGLGSSGSPSSASPSSVENSSSSFVTAITETF